MKFSNIILGLRNFKQEQEVKKYIANSKYYANEDPSEAELLLVYQNTREKTWLVFSNQRLYCILDKVKKTDLHINWSVSYEELFDQDGKIRVNTMSIYQQSYVVQIGEHRLICDNKLCSKEHISGELCKRINRRRSDK